VVFELRIRLEDEPFRFDRVFFVEILRGGMNRLLLRSLPTDTDAARHEVLFQYVQGIELMTMNFEGLSIEVDALSTKFTDLEVQFPECRTYRLDSASGRGLVFASACVWESRVVEADDPSFFPNM
jgi:hypothetical protein